MHLLLGGGVKGVVHWLKQLAANIQPQINAAARVDIHSANGVTQGLHVN